MSVTKEEMLRLWGKLHMIPTIKLYDTPLLEMTETDEEVTDDETDEVREYEGDILDDPRQYEGVVRS